MIAGVLRLNRKDISKLNVRDAYSLHRIVYDLFADVRTDEQKRQSQPSGFLYADKGGDGFCRQILLLSNRTPKQPNCGELQTKEIPPHFLSHARYRFEVVINPAKRNSHSRKLEPVKGRAAITQWFIERAPINWGFTVEPSTLMVNQLRVQQFHKNNHHKVTLGTATLQGVLTVSDQQQFENSFCTGIGRGRAFGCGLLQIVPVN